jgi:hypothetical protein
VAALRYDARRRRLVGVTPDARIAWAQAFPGVELAVQLARLEVHLANTRGDQAVDLAQFIPAWLARSMRPRS